MRMPDEFCQQYQSCLEGVYDCVDRIVLNVYFMLAQSEGGFRTWWRLLRGSDEDLDNTHQRTEAIRVDTNSPFTLCQFSMSYAVAGALTDGEFGLKQLSEKRIRDPKIHRLASRVKVVTDPELDKLYPASRPAIMEITTKSGEKFSGRLDYAKGYYLNPMTEEELMAKFLGLTQGVVGEKKAKKALDTVLDLENLDSVEKLIPYLK